MERIGKLFFKSSVMILLCCFFGLICYAQDSLAEAEESSEQKTSSANTKEVITTASGKQVYDIETSSKDNVVKLASANRHPSGKLKKKGGKTVYQLKDGTLLQDTWIKIGSYIYYFDQDGFAVKGAFQYEGNSYFFDSRGRLYVDRLRKSGSKVWYYGPSGAMLKRKWVRLKNGVHVYFQSDGLMARKKWINGNYVKANGALDFTKGTGSVTKFKAASGQQKLVIIAASRGYHMQLAVGSRAKNTIFLCKSGAKYSWFANTAVPKLKKILAQYPKSKVVIQMGNNDIGAGAKEGNAKKYFAAYRNLISSYPKASFYFMDVLPRENLESARSKKSEEFNAKLKKAFPARYIGGYNWLVKNGFTTSYNSAHYSATTSRRIYNYIIQAVTGKAVIF